MQRPAKDEFLRRCWAPSFSRSRLRNRRQSRLRTSLVIQTSWRPSPSFQDRLFWVTFPWKPLSVWKKFSHRWSWAPASRSITHGNTKPLSGPFANDWVKAHGFTPKGHSSSLCMYVHVCVCRDVCFPNKTWLGCLLQDMVPLIC